MNWKNNCLHKLAPATIASLNKLKEATHVSLPTEYYELLSFTNGGEWELAVQPYLFISDSTETVSDAIKSKDYEEFFPGFIMIGSNGAGEFISLDIRQIQPYPVVAIDMTNSDLSETVLIIAESFQSFLKLLGTRSPELD